MSATRLHSVEPAEGGERGVVEAGAHAEADHQPREDEDGQIRCEREWRDPPQGELRSPRGPGGRHNGRLRRRRSARPALDEQAERERADDPGQRPAGVARDRLGKHGQEVVGRAPGQDLDDPSDETTTPRRVAAQRAAPPPRRRRPSRGDLQPQPSCPPALATASATQQAFASAGAGPPQQPVAERRSRSADAGLGKHQANIVGSGEVAVDRGDHRADLFVAGGEKEGRRAAVALDADGVEARLRMARARDGRAAAPSRRSAGSDRSAGPSARTLSSQGSSSSRSSRVMSRSGRWPVQTMISSMPVTSWAASSTVPFKVRPSAFSDDRRWCGSP